MAGTVKGTEVGSGAGPKAETARATSVGQQQAPPVDAVEKSLEPPIGLQRSQQTGRGVPVAVAIEIARHQSVAQIQKGGLRDVREAVAPQRLELAGVEQPLDLAAVDAVFPRQPDGAGRAVERGHLSGAVVRNHVAQIGVPLLAEAIAVPLAAVVPAEVEAEA